MPTARRRAHGILGLYACLSLLAVSVWPHFPSPNELTRVFVAASIVEHGSFEVSAVVAELGMVNEDLARRDGLTFSNKAPGLALLATPAYIACRLFAGPVTRANLRPHLWAMRWLGATVPVLLLGFLFLGAARRLGLSEEREPAVLGALLFATPLHAYGQLLFAHALVAAALFAAWTALFARPHRITPALAELLAGGLISVAVISEYPAAIPGAVLVVASCFGGGWRRPLRVCAGGMPLAAVLLSYNATCFGSPFALSSAYEAQAEFQALASRGLFGIGLPSPGILGSLLLDPGKGLLLFSPLLVLAAPGLVSAFRTLPRAASISLGAIPISVILTYAGYGNWHGGFTTGARYLVSAMPFLVFTLVFRRGGALESGLLGASAAAVGLVSLTFPFVPPEAPLPWASLGWRLATSGLVAPNLLHLLSPAAAVAVPFLLYAMAVGLAADRRLAALLGALIWVGGSFPTLRARGLPLEMRIGRAYIEEVYFERTGALERDFPGWERALPRLAARRDREMASPPVGWPF